MSFRVGSLVLFRKNDMIELGLIVEVPPPTERWGVTGVVRWLSDGFEEEVTETSVEVICK